MLVSEQERVRELLQAMWNKYSELARISDANEEDLNQLEDEFYGACTFVSRYFGCRVTISGNTVAVED